MICIVAKRYLKPGVLDEYTALAKELVESSRLEAGCADYGLYYKADENLCVMVEKWETQEALDVHSARLAAENWPQRLNAYADPEKKGGPEIFKQII